LQSHFGHLCRFHVQDRHLSGGKGGQNLLVTLSLRADSQDRYDMILGQKILKLPGKPEIKRILGRCFTDADRRTDGPDLQVRMKTSRKTAKNDEIRHTPGDFHSESIFSRFRSHAAFDEDNLLIRKFEGKFLERFPSNETPAGKKSFQRRVFLRQSCQYQNFHLYVRPY